MIIYQVEIKVDPSIEREWFKWMKGTHVPDLIMTGLISSYNIWKDTDQNHTYIFNYIFSTENDLNLYLENHAPRLKKDVLDKFPDKFEAKRRIYVQV